jgi:hypothetical protein
MYCAKCGSARGRQHFEADDQAFVDAISADGDDEDGT